MAYGYQFYRPARLPLETDELSAETFLALDNAAAVREALESAFPEIEWAGSEGRVTRDGLWMEFRLPDGRVNTLTLRCSLRGDYRAIVQRLSDHLGWVAFDETPACYQPGRPPMRA